MTTNLPAHLASRANRPNLARAAVEQFGVTLPPHVSIAGGRFTLIDGAGNERPVQTLHLDCVIVDMGDNLSRIYYRDPFNPSDRLPPVCFSDNGVGASSRAVEPQSASCATCQWAKWGSAVSKISGKGIPACQNGIKLALMLVNVDVAGNVTADPQRICYMLRLPPNSINPFKAYGKMVDGQKDVDFCDLVTRITFSREEQFTLEFQAIGWCDPETAKLEDELWESKRTDQLVGRDDVPISTRMDAPMIPPPAAQHLPPPPPAPTANVQATNQQPTSVPSPVLPGAEGQRAAEAAVEKRGRGRPRKEPAAPAPVTPPPPIPPAAPVAPFMQQRPPAAPAAHGVEPIPAFLRRDLPKPADQAQQPARFGIQEGPPAPNPELMAALDKAMALPE